MAEQRVARDVGKVQGLISTSITAAEFNRYASNNDEYRAERFIGNGFFGAVFLATSKSRPQKVAIKVSQTDISMSAAVLKGMTSSSIRQALREVQFLAKLQHPYILQLLDAYRFTTKGGGQGIAIVTEYCGKGNLQQYLESYRPIEEKRHEWCEQLAEAMQYIHHQGIIHRDIKPDNILITSKDVMKIGDVGIAKAAWDLGTGYKDITDVPYEMYICSIAAPAAYMAPEVFEYRYHRASDIFSLGLVFIMIVECPGGDLIPLAQYAGECDVLGRLLYVIEKSGARVNHPTDLFQNGLSFSTQSERRLFDKMLMYDYKARSTADEVLAEIKDMNRVRGTQLKAANVDKQEPQGQNLSGCPCC